MMLKLPDAPGSREPSTNGVLSDNSMSPSMTQLAIAVIVPPTANRQFFLSPTRTHDPRALSNASNWMGYPAWSDDEQHLAVELKDGSSTDAAVLGVASGTMRQLRSERGQTWVRSWSPDGSKIAAAVFRNGR
jgi:Tol biopolymer transport system component